MASISGSMSNRKNFSTNYLRCGYGKSSIAATKLQNIADGRIEAKISQNGIHIKEALPHRFGWHSTLTSLQYSVSHSLNKLSNMTTAVPCHRPLHWEYRIPQSPFLVYDKRLEQRHLASSVATVARRWTRMSAFSTAWQRWLRTLVALSHYCSRSSGVIPTCQDSLPLSPQYSFMQSAPRLASVKMLSDRTLSW